MTTSNTNRGPRAGQLQAGDMIADGQNLVDLLAFDSVAAGVKIGDMLRERLAMAERAVTRHTDGAEDAQLRGDDAERAHAEEGARLQREVNRLRLAIERADQRLAEVATAERQADARAKLKSATKAAARAEAIVATDYPTAARTVAALLEELRAMQGEVIAARRAARDAGLDAEADALALPHERRTRPGAFEEVEFEVLSGGAAVIDAASGREVIGERSDGRSVLGDMPQRATRLRVERRFVPGRSAPDLTAARVILPDTDREGAYIVKQGEAR
ncbi:hypothetical protein [Fulvimonas yonginensis]|uniref:HlyD family secretion protein n=1 Tax=Fulvimonas yonginensis TaxID=1495200 RepID=A0ABU8J9D5_9GAMM